MMIKPFSGFGVLARIRNSTVNYEYDVAIFTSMRLLARLGVAAALALALAPAPAEGLWGGKG